MTDKSQTTPEMKRMEAVFTAVRQADHRYDSPAPDSQDMTRPEYVGRAALKALNVDYINAALR